MNSSYDTEKGTVHNEEEEQEMEVRFFTLKNVLIAIACGFGIFIVFYFASGMLKIENGPDTGGTIYNRVTMTRNDYESDLVDPDICLSVEDELQDTIIYFLSGQECLKLMKFDVKSLETKPFTYEINKIARDIKRPKHYLRVTADPDGITVAFFQYEDETAPNSSPSHLILYNGENSQKVPLVDNHSPSCSYCFTPDGNGIYYTSQTSNAIYKIDLDGNNHKIVVNKQTGKIYCELVMTNDGTLIYAEVTQLIQNGFNSLIYQIYKKERDDKTPETIYINGRSNTFPRLSYTTGVLIVNSSDSIFVLDLSTSPPAAKMFSIEGYNRINLAIMSKCGKYLYFSARSVDSSGYSIAVVKFNLHEIQNGQIFTVENVLLNHLDHYQFAIM